MFKIKIYTQGKSREQWLVDALAEYTKRLQKVARIEWNISKTEKELEERLSHERNYICLDSQGTQMTSKSFALFLETALLQFQSRLSFVVGGPEGIAPSLLSRATHMLSLSQMTLTHQMARLLLLEQMYRAFEIQRGSSYHK